jgi:hypothetical protein
MDKIQYTQLANKVGHNHIHFTVKDGKDKMVVNKKVEAKV